MTTHHIAPPHAPTRESTAPDDTQPIRAVRESVGWRTWLARLALLTAAGLILLMLLVGLFVAAHQIQYAARIYPGVSTYGISLGGLTRDEAVRVLDARFVYDDQAVFTFRDRDDFWQVTAGELGVSFDVAGTVDAAMRLGRSEGLFANLVMQAEMWFNGRSISPIILYDQTVAERLLRQIAREIDRPAVDASLVLAGTDVLATESQVGRAVNIPATLDLLRAEILRLDSGAEIPLVIEETLPVVASVAEAAAQARAALSSPLALYADAESGGEAGPWVAVPETIATMLSIERVTGEDGTASYALRLNPEQFVSFLNGVAPQLATQPQDARFIFNDETRQLEVIQDSVDGRELDVEATLARIEEALFTPAEDPSAPRRVPLVFRRVAPALHGGLTAADLGITELVSQATTYFLGSTASRQANIAQAAARFHGIVIPPGQEFSFNHWLGDVSAEAGFEEGLIIFGGRTIRGVGGGVCQVSTTAFQAAFYAGYPILERYPHGYRVGYYEYGEGVGMDATVYSPLVDFRFLNDTPYHLLIETYVNRDNATVTFKFYSTGVGREVVKIGPRVTNIVPYGPTVYEESADLAPGQTRQVDWAVDGADVTVTRQVFRNGQLEFEDHFFSHYLPWRAVIQVAPGEIPVEGGPAGAEDPNAAPLAPADQGNG